MYHLELRQFPHNLCRFNLSEQELCAIVEPWARDPWVELGERKWRPETAKITVLEGPHMPLDQLSMGRGWRAVQRNSTDVTERVLETAKRAVAAVSQGPPQPPPADAALVADSLGLELLAALADGPVALSRAWRLAGARFPERSPSECLALAEGAVRSLLRAGLVELLKAGPDDSQQSGDPHLHGERVGEGDVDRLLRTPDSWAGQGGPGDVLLRRV